MNDVISRGRLFPRVCAFGVATAVVMCFNSADAYAGPLNPRRLYVGINQAMEVKVDRPADAASVRLVLLDAGGRVISRSGPIEGGSVSVDQVLSGVWSGRDGTGSEAVGMSTTGMGPADQAIAARGVVYVQMEVGRDVVGEGDEKKREYTMEGAALVLQPMVSPARGEVRSGAGVAGAAGGAGGVEMVFPKEKQATVSCFSGYRVYVDGVVRMKTGAGELTIKLRPELAPNTAWNFRHLAESGFYDGTDFHRVVPVGRIAGKGFVVQGGDPTSTGEGTPGYDIAFEPTALKHDFGVVSMARDAEANTAGAQFFICLSRDETARLDGLYCAFGQIVEGESVRTLRAIESGKLLPGGDRPEKPVKIERAWVEDAPARDKQPTVARVGGADGGR